MPRNYNTLDNGFRKNRNQNISRRDQKYERPSNASMEIELFELNKTVRSEYDKATLIEILANVQFDKISIPVYAYKDQILGEDKKGTMIVGFVNSFEPEEELFNITIYGNYVEKISKFVDAIIFARLVSDNETGEVKTILGLDICPLEKYAFLYDEEAEGEEEDAD